MAALLSSPVRRWLLATLLLPLIAFVLSKVGLYLQRRNGGKPTRLSRARLSVSAITRRHSNRGHDDNDLIDNPRPDAPSITAPPTATTPPCPSSDHLPLGRSHGLKTPPPTRPLAPANPHRPRRPRRRPDAGSTAKKATPPAASVAAAQKVLRTVERREATLRKSLDQQTKTLKKVKKSLTVHRDTVKALETDLKKVKKTRKSVTSAL